MSVATTYKLTQQQREGYRENGFLVIEGLIEPEEVQHLLQEATCICRGVYPIPGIEPMTGEESDEEALAKYLCIHQPHKTSRVIEQYVRHPRIAAVLSQLISPNVKCMQSMLFIKPPGFPGQAYHQDERYIPTEDRSLTGAWIALDDATVENGCLWVVPGSQRDEMHPWALHDNPEYDSADEAQNVPREREVPVEVKAGAVVFFNGYLLHSSLRNRSNKHRRVLVNHYMSAESRLRWSGNQDYRDVIIVAGEDPYASEGYTDIARPHLRALRREKPPETAADTPKSKV